jgi:pyridoxal phosphate enzyme (YggS family)
MIVKNLEDVKRRIAMACTRTHRSKDNVRLVCVTKEASVEAIKQVILLGVRIIGENRVQDAILKHKDIGGAAEWHMIGHLQTNKVKDAVRIFSLIHSVDSLKLAAEIDKQASGIGKVQDILIEVNVSGETSKYGVGPDNLSEFFKEISAYSNISVKGLMTMAPESADPETARPYFRRLHELLEELNAAHCIPPSASPLTGPCRLDLRSKSGVPCVARTLSMGMSGDFEIAIEEGATMVRIGRAIFGR